MTAHSDAPGESVTVIINLDGDTVNAESRSGETILETARRAGLEPPYSCEAGNCGSCIAMIVAGSATMQVNEVLDADEIADGYILTCQAIPDGAVVVTYED